MKIDISQLENWPDPDTIFNSASSLMTSGAEFHTAIEGAHSTWKGLTAGDNYVTPHSDLLYSALEPALTTATHASDGCTNVKTAMTLFSAAISGLRTERDTVKAEVEAFNAKKEPTDAVKLSEHEQEGQRLQTKVNDLVNKYETAIDECANRLAATKGDGTFDPGCPAWAGVAVQTVIAAAVSTAESRKFNIEHVVRRFHLRVFGVDFDFKYSSTNHRTNFWDWDSWKVHRTGDGSFLNHFSARLQSQLLGPPRGQWGSPTITKPHGMPRPELFRPSSWFGGGTQTTTRTYTGGVSALGRTAGRGLFLLGAGLIYASEHEKADRHLQEQHPELTASERQSQVIETAAVRTGSQVAAAAAAGAAIGSVLPVGGTAIGLAVGLGVGLAMTLDPDGDGKSLGDNIADAGEGAWNGLKQLFGGH